LVILESQELVPFAELWIPDVDLLGAKGGRYRHRQGRYRPVTRLELVREHTAGNEVRIAYGVLQICDDCAANILACKKRVELVRRFQTHALGNCSVSRPRIGFVVAQGFRHIEQRAEAIPELLFERRCG